MDAKALLSTNIIDLLGLQALPEPRKTELITRMSEVVQDRITDRVLESLSADARAEFDQFLDRQATERDIAAFLQKNVPEYTTIATEEILLFKKQMVDDVDLVRKIATAL